MPDDRKAENERDEAKERDESLDEDLTPAAEDAEDVQGGAGNRRRPGAPLTGDGTAGY